MTRFRTDLLRLLSMGMVLAIHATGPYEYHFLKSHDFFSQDWLAVVLNQLARFSVPVFIMLSGYGLIMKYGLIGEKDGLSPQQNRIPVKSFFAERAYKIGLPFLAWSILYLAIQGKLKGPYTGEWLLGLLPYLYRTGADYHFYFFHIIFECYLVFPALAYTMSRLPRFRTPILILSFLLQLYVSSPAHIWFSDLPRIPFLFSAFILYWQFPFVLGIYYAFRSLKTRENLVSTGQALNGSSQQFEHASGNAPRAGSRTHPVSAAYGKARAFALAFGVTGAFALALWEYVFWSWRSENPGDFDHFTRMSVMIYSALFFLAFYYWPEKERLPRQEPNVWSRWIPYLAGLSFFVFIAHTWILRGLQQILPEWMLVVLILLIILSFGLAAVLDRIVKPAILRTALGLDSKKTR